LLGGPGFCLYFLLLILRNKNTGTATYSQEHQEFDEPVMPIVVPSQPIAPALQSTHADTPNAPLPAMGEALKKTAYNLHDKGLSLFGIYGLTETTEDLPELLETIAIATPPRYLKDMDGWQKAIEEQAYRRFFQELTRATEGGEPDLPSLIRIFPAREDEEVMDYLERLNSTGQVLADMLNKGE